MRNNNKQIGQKTTEEPKDSKHMEDPEGPDGFRLFQRLFPLSLWNPLLPFSDLPTKEPGQSGSDC